MTGRTHTVFNVHDKKLSHFALLQMITAAGAGVPLIVVPALKPAERARARTATEVPVATGPAVLPLRRQFDYASVVVADGQGRE
jgi:hypothetical protein